MVLLSSLASAHLNNGGEAAKVEVNVPPAGFTALFNGKDLSGWKGLVANPVKRREMSPGELHAAYTAANARMRKHWSVRNGTLVFDGRGDSLVTEKDYADFELYVDWMIEPGGDSGIYLRGSPQVQIWDNPVGSGGLYNNQKYPSKPLHVADNPPGEWNTFHIIMIGQNVTVYLNDQCVVENTPLENYWERNRPIYESGPVELQSHGSVLRFRNIFIREITDPQAEKDLLINQRMKWWRQARFGMFIHWGLYALPGGEWNGQPVPGVSEWIMYHGRIPVKDYEPLVNQFNPVNFDADEWVATAKRAGVKYIVITSKHHDGFCLFDSDFTDYDIMSTPFRRDILKELADACHEQGIKICWYYSIMDWHHPDYLPRRPWDLREELQPDFNCYVKYLHRQIGELLTNYGEIGVMWFDGEWENTWTHDMGRELYDYVRNLDPDIIINNRVDKGRSGMQGLTGNGNFRGDFGTPEQEVPPTGLPGVDWETCMTMNNSWGYKKNDHNYKSGVALVRRLIEIASKGGNFLLNVGPQPDGQLPPEAVQRLEYMGNWLNVNGESIYGSLAGPFTYSPWGKCTLKNLPGGNTRLFLHVFHWPGDGNLHVPGLQNKPLRAFLLADPAAGDLPTARENDELIIKVPAEPLHEAATVVVLDINGKPHVLPPVIRESEQGVVILPAARADLHGSTIRLEEVGSRGPNIGYWNNINDSVEWEYETTAPGEFNIQIELSCPEVTAGGTFAIISADQKLSATVPPTGGWQTYQSVDMGNINIPAAGKQKLLIKGISLQGYALMNVRRVILTRIVD